MYLEIIKILTEKNKQIATMESCTGGALASHITNYKGASNILKYSAVTYSNEYKIKMGVDKDIIAKYTVYSIETAKSMAKNISLFANSNYGVGITGQLSNNDPKNKGGEVDFVYIAIYDKDNDKYYKYDLKVTRDKTRCEKKEEIVNFIGNKLLNIIK